jgi:hypothetical protein
MHVQQKRNVIHTLEQCRLAASSHRPARPRLCEVMLSEIAPGLDRLSCLVLSSVRSATFHWATLSARPRQSHDVGAMLQRRCPLCAATSTPAAMRGSYARIASGRHLGTSGSETCHASPLSPCPSERGRGCNASGGWSSGFETVPGGRVGGRLAPKLVRRPCPREPEDADFVGVLAWWSRGGSNP